MVKRSEPAVTTKSVVGTCRVYSRDGEVLWEKEAFVVGEDKVPRSLSIVMVAMQVLDPKTRKRLVKWDPWGYLGDK